MRGLLKMNTDNFYNVILFFWDLVQNFSRGKELFKVL